MARAEKSTATDIQKVQPARHLGLFEDFDQFFDNFFSRGWMRPFQWENQPLAERTAPFEGRMPHVDVIDRDAEILVKAELPGVEKKDLDISVTRNAVTIKGTTSHESKEEEGNYYRCELSRGSYARTLILPSDVDEDKAKASFKNGILELTLPKIEKAKRRTIEVE